MEKVKKLIKYAFSTPSNIEEMNFLELLIDGLIGGVVLGIIINLIKLVLFIIIPIIFMIISSFLF